MGTDDWLIQRLPPHLQAISVIIGGVLVQLSLGGIYTFGKFLKQLFFFYFCFYFWFLDNFFKKKLGLFTKVEKFILFLRLT